MNTRPRRARRAAFACAALAAATLFTGCAPLVVGSVVGGSLMAIDRRTAGAQVDDQSIELKAAQRVRELATLGNVSVTSYNRLVLITGQVPEDGERRRVEEAVAKIENVRSVVNELAVAGNTSLSQRSNDLLLSTKVKATFVDAKDLQAQTIKVVAERGTVYLMGRVTDREAERASRLAASVPGVQKVVRVFEPLTEAELARLNTAPQPAPAPAPAAPR